MKFIDIEQGTLEWHGLRRSRIGASVSSALMGQNPFKSAYDVYREMVLGDTPFINAAMKRGSDEEWKARDFFNRKHFTAFLPAMIENTCYPYLMASLDGIDTDKKIILEIKTPGDKVFEQCRNMDIPKYWEIQIQHQLLVSEYEQATLFVWKNEEENFTIHYFRDDEMMEKIDKTCVEFFEKNLLNATPPPPEYKERTDSDWKYKAERWRRAKAHRESAEKEEKEAYQELLTESSGEPTIGFHVRVERSEVRGRVDYDLIDELKAVDLEKYRKPTTIRWRICEA